MEEEHRHQLFRQNLRFIHAKNRYVALQAPDLQNIGASSSKLSGASSFEHRRQIKMNIPFVQSLHAKNIRVLVIKAPALEKRGVQTEETKKLNMYM